MNPPPEALPVPEVNLSRRSFLVGMIGGVGAAVTGVVVMDTLTPPSDDELADALPEGADSAEGTNSDGTTTSAPTETPEPFTPPPRPERSTPSVLNPSPSQVEKATPGDLAAANKTNADAAKTYADADHTAAETDDIYSKMRDEQSKTAAANRETDAKIETTRIENWWKQHPWRHPSNVTAITAVAGVLGGAFKFLIDRGDKMRLDAAKAATDRADALRKERTDYETAFRTSLDNLAAADPTVRAKAGKELVAYADSDHQQQLERVISAAVGILRERPTANMNAQPDPFYGNVIRAFFLASGKIREVKLAELAEKLEELERKKPPEDDIEAGMRRADIYALRSRTVIGAEAINLSSAVLHGENLSAMDLDGALFVNTKIVGGNVEWADLRGADFTGAQLLGVTISNVRLEGANFIGAILDGSKLIDVDFTGNDQAILEAKSVHGAQFNGTKGLPDRTQTRLHRRGAIIIKRDDYGPPNTAQGDETPAPGTAPPAGQQQ